MRLLSKYVFFGLLLFNCITAYSESLLSNVQLSNIANTTNNITIENGYIRETIPGTSISSAYMTISNHSDKAIVLKEITSEVSDRLELHTHQASNGIMRMRKLDRIIIPANEQVVLQPSGLHIMIFDLDKRLKAQEEVKLNFQFLNNESQNIILPVRSIKKTPQH